jgi:hypothetical protein
MALLLRDGRFVKDEIAIVVERIHVRSHGRAPRMADALAFRQPDLHPFLPDYSF